MRNRQGKYLLKIIEPTGFAYYYMFNLLQVHHRVIWRYAVVTTCTVGVTRNHFSIRPKTRYLQ